jgi:hypothetical protein
VAESVESIRPATQRHLAPVEQLADRADGLGQPVQPLAGPLTKSIA